MTGRGLRRAVWCDIAADFHSSLDVDKFVNWCLAVKVDLVLPCINHGTGVLCYPSNLVPTAVGYDSWDALGYLVKRCHDWEIEVHPWLVVANWGSSLLSRMAGSRYIPGGPKPLQEAHPDWFVVDMYGHSVLESPSVAFGEGGTCFLDPGNSFVRAFLMDLTDELFARYPEVDGLHLDYIRYESVSARMEWLIQGASDVSRHVRPGDSLWISKPSTKYPGAEDLRLYYEVTSSEQNGMEGRPTRLKLEHNYKYCYCRSCLSAFAEAHGLSYPEGANTREKHDWIWANYEQEWVTWRAEQVTGLVRAFSNAVRGKHGKKLSAATFWNHPPVIRSHGQDWIKWINEGLLDFVNPMTYWIPPEKVREMTQSYIDRTGHACPVYSGIITSPGYPIRPEEIKGYMAAIKDGGGDGITLFCYSTWGDVARWEEGIGAKYRSVLQSEW